LLLSDGLTRAAFFSLFFAWGSAQACPVEDPLNALFLLPLDVEQGVLGQTFLDGVIAADEALLEDGCELNLRYLDTQLGESPDQLWQQVVEYQPDVLLGPLIPSLQRQLMEAQRVSSLGAVTWLIPGIDLSNGVDDQPEGVTYFSVGVWERSRNLLEYAWEQGENRLALLFPKEEKWQQLIEQIDQNWNERGGMIDLVQYGARFGDLNGAVAQIQEEVDGVVVLADPARLQMVRPLMDFHSRQQPIYSINLPLGESSRSRDLDGVLFPLQPVMAENEKGSLVVDDLLLEIENVGFDLMQLLRKGGLPWLRENGSFFGQSGRYTLEQGRLSRALCIVRQQGGQREILQCPERDTD